MNSTKTKKILELKEDNNFALAIIDIKQAIEDLGSKDKRLKMKELNKKNICSLLNIDEEEFYKDMYGKPWVKIPKIQVSGSHTEELLAVLKVNTVMAGIDIEKAGKRARNIKDKFLSKSEKDFVDIDDIRYYQIIWSAKEVLYKCYGRRKVDFRKHLRIHEFEASDKGEITGDIKLTNFEGTVKMSYFFIEEHVVVYSHGDFK